MLFALRFVEIKIFTFLYLITINVFSYGQNLNQTNLETCNCRQIYTYKSSNNFKLVDNVILNEYYNDTLLIVKYGSYNFSRKLDFNNFNEYEKRRDTFIIQNGIYSKIINLNKMEILSPQMFNLKKKSISINVIHSIPIVNRKIFIPKEMEKHDSLTYYLYEVISDSFTPNEIGPMFMDSISNISNYHDSINELNFGFDYSRQIFYFVPGWGFLKIDSWGTAGKIEGIDFIFTSNCSDFLNNTFKNWRY
jgi:hypothetical protein